MTSPNTYSRQMPGTHAANFSKSSSGESVMPVVPSDHGQLKRYMRSPLASCSSRSSDKAPRAVYGLSLETIGQETDVPVGTVKKRLHVARQRLKRALEPVLG